MEYSEDKGVEAIIDLQSVVGITEPEERARAAWKSFKGWEKEATIRTHKSMFPEKYEETHV